MNVLIVPGTTLIAREICNSLSTMKGIYLFGAGYDAAAAKNFPYHVFNHAGTLGSKNLKDELEVIVERQEIDFIIFAHDSWIFEFRNLDSIGEAKIIKNPCAAIEICSFKSSTYGFLREDVSTPTIFKLAEEVQDFPVFLKPNRGQGSIGALKIDSRKELEPFMDSEGRFYDHWVVSEFLPGIEYTIDCFSALNGDLLYSSPRIRMAIESGLAVETKIIRHPQLSIWASRISKKLLLNGPWFFQVKEDSKGSLKLMEIGLRVAGGSGVQRLKGVNLSQLNILQSQGKVLEILNQNVFPCKKKNEIDLDFDYQEIYVDYDDTLIVNFVLNHKLIAFLESEINRGIIVTLITRHSGNLEDSLTQFGIRELFSRIIHITNKHLKSKYIDSNVKFLFIDDSFRERSDVSVQFGNRGLVLDESFVLE